MGANDASRLIPVDELIHPPTSEASGCACSSNDAAENCCATAPQVETQVKLRYDTLAAQGASTLCCSPQAVYSPEELHGIPSWVLELSSGCGAPLDSVGLRQGQTVVDFGCGAGLDLLIAARRVGPEGRVIGIDGSINMVRTARKAATEAGTDNIDVRVGDIRRPPLRVASVDVLLSNCVLGMFPDKLEVLRAMADVLRPGGVAVISDVVYADGDLPPDITTDDSASADDYARCVVGMTETQYRDMVAAAGFDRVEIKSEGLVPYRDGAQVTSAMVFAYRGEQSENGRCC